MYDRVVAHRLEVAVEDVERVQVGNGRHNLGSVEACLGFLEDTRPVQIKE